VARFNLPLMFPQPVKSFDVSGDETSPDLIRKTMEIVNDEYLEQCVPIFPGGDASVFPWDCLVAIGESTSILTGPCKR
jgi:hypothetical protein